MEIQKNFFETLRSKLPPYLRLADELSDLLGIGTDSAYRRIRGEKELSISELSVLCEHFDISMDAMLGSRSNNVIFQKSYQIKNDLEEYYLYVKSVAEKMETIASSKSKEIYFLAENIPSFHLMMYPELVLFKVFVWHHMGSDNNLSYDDFIETIDKELLMGYYDRMVQSYEKIPSKEVWVKGTIGSILYLLEYYYDLNKFKSPETCILLCNQLLQLIDHVEQWAEKGNKGNGGDTPYSLYFSSIHPENSFMITKRDDIRSATVNIFVINRITTTNESFCIESEKWMNGIIEKSLNFSGSAKRERFMFFQSMRDRITDLMKKFENKEAV